MVLGVTAWGKLKQEMLGNLVNTSFDAGFLGRLGTLWNGGEADACSASNNIKAHDSVGFFVFIELLTINLTINF